MDRRVVIIGGSVGGLASAIGLARKGWSVTVVERDPGSPTTSGDEPFLSWQRPHVPQFRQPHFFSARSRNLLLEHIPDVVDRLLADGIEEFNLFKLLAPKELWTDEDDAFTGLMTRRPAFELPFRQVAESEPGVEVLAPAVVRGLLFAADRSPGSVPRVTGIRLDDGTTLDADVVLDCGGRRTPVPKWLAEVGVEMPQEVQDCEGNYHCRYYRKRSDGMPSVALFGIGGQFADGAFAVGFPGDHDTFGIGLFCSADDDDLKVLRHDWAWDVVLNALPSIAPWVAPDHAVPLHDVQFMGGHQNVRRQFVVDGRPVVHGLLPVGDSLCTTNPRYGWGASMALTYAFAAVAAVDDLAADPEALALAYDAAVAAEADGVYRESAAMDRMGIYEARGEEVPEHDRAEMDRQALIQYGLAAGAMRDPVLGRAMLRRTNLLDRPDAVFDDPEVLSRATAVLEKGRGRPRLIGPGRAELLALLAEAAPTPVAAGT